MRMSAGMRVLLTIYLIVVICCFLFVLATMFGMVPSASLESVIATAIRGGFWYKLLYAVICVVMIIVSFILMFFGIRKAHHHESTITIAQNSGGDIVITTKAVEELVQREVMASPGVRGATSRVISHGDFIDVLVHLSVAPGQDIPELTKEIQAKLQNDLLSKTGVTLRDLKLSVTDVSESMAKNNKKAPRVI